MSSDTTVRETKINTLNVIQTRGGQEVIRIDYYQNNPDYARLLVQIDDGFSIETHQYFDTGEYWQGEVSDMDLIEGYKGYKRNTKE